MRCFSILWLNRENLSSYKDETSFDAAFEKQFLEEKLCADRAVYLCAVVDGHIVGIANVDGIGRNEIRSDIAQNWGLRLIRLFTALE